MGLRWDLLPQLARCADCRPDTGNWKTGPMVEGRTTRVAVVHHGFVPAYRVAFYERLNRESVAAYVVFHGKPPQGMGHEGLPGPFRFPNVEVRNRVLRVGRWLLVYQPVLRHIVRGRYSAVVLGHELKFVSNVLLLVLCRCLRIPVLLWGQGYHARSGAGERPASGISAHIVKNVKGFLGTFADGYIAYTARGAATLEELGMPRERIWAVNNTVDIEELSRLHAAAKSLDPSELRHELHLDQTSAVLLFVGRLIPGKDVDQLPFLARELNARRGMPEPVELVVIGDGPERTRLQQAAANLSGFHVVGAIYDPERLAKYYRVAKAVVAPGPVGLIVNEAFANGLPVLIRQLVHHGPEIDFVRHGVNGLIAGGDFLEFVSQVEQFMRSPEMQRRLAEGASQTRAGLGLDYMVRQFDLAVLTTIGRHRERPASLQAKGTG